MPLPSNYQTLKIHPAIGVARVSINDDYFVYGTETDTFKSNDLIKRQAIQFRIFAYGANNSGIEELTPERLAELGLSVRWLARVANRKMADLREDDAFVIEAETASDTNDGKLVGSLARFVNAAQVPLGQITETGLFIAPVAQIYNAEPAAQVPSSSNLHDRNVTDNSSDGSIAVELFEADGSAVTIPVLGAWVFVTPPDFAPDTDDDEAETSSQQRTLERFLVEGLLLPNVPPVNPVNQAARELDRDILRRCTGDFAPGIETSMARFEFDIAALRELLYPPIATGDPDEVRFAPEAEGGAVPGELTFGLCSPWQFDFRACTCGFWPAQRPDTAFASATSPVRARWLRKRANDLNGSQGMLTSKQDFVDHVYKLGILREASDRIIETERDNDIA